MEIHTEMPWWCQETDNIMGSWKVPPYSNFYIGSAPTAGMKADTAKQFDAFVNVADQSFATFIAPDWNPDVHYRVAPIMHWHPIDEFGKWGYEPFYWSKHVLDHHHAKGDKVYLHCKAGKHRSPMIFLQWLLSRGHKLDEAIKFTFSDKHERQRIESVLRHDIAKGHIPGNLGELHKRMNANPDKSLAWVLKHNESGERHAL